MLEPSAASAAVVVTADGQVSPRPTAAILMENPYCSCELTRPTASCM